MNETVITTVVLAFVLAVAAAGTAIVLVALVRAIRHHHSSVAERGRRAITGLAIDRRRRQMWGAGVPGSMYTGTEFGSGGGFFDGGGGCGGGGCGGGCGGG